jgi:hypothetical protein
MKVASSDRCKFSGKAARASFPHGQSQYGIRVHTRPAHLDLRHYASVLVTLHRDRVEKFRQIYIDDEPMAFGDIGLRLRHRLLGKAARPEAVAVLAERPPTRQVVSAAEGPNGPRKGLKERASSSEIS